MNLIRRRRWPSALATRLHAIQPHWCGDFLIFFSHLLGTAFFLFSSACPPFSSFDSSRALYSVRHGVIMWSRPWCCFAAPWLFVSFCFGAFHFLFFHSSFVSLALFHFFLCSILEQCRLPQGPLRPNFLLVSNGDMIMILLSVILPLGDGLEI